MGAVRRSCRGNSRHESARTPRRSHQATITPRTASRLSSTRAISSSESSVNGPSPSLRRSSVRGWSTTTWDSVRKPPRAPTVTRSGSVSRRTSLVRGRTTTVRDWAALSQSPCTTSTGRIFPNSRPRLGFRLAVQIWPLRTAAVTTRCRSPAVPRPEVVFPPAPATRCRTAGLRPRVPWRRSRLRRQPRQDEQEVAHGAFRSGTAPTRCARAVTSADRQGAIPRSAVRRGRRKV